MKKTLWLIFLLSLLCSFTFSACDKEKDVPKDDDTNQSTNDENNTDDEDNNSENEVVCQHSFGDWIVEKQATCKENGLLTRACLKCSEREETTIAKTNDHTVVINAAVDATCDKTGLTEGKYCSLCEKVLMEQIEIPLKPHTYDDKYDETCNNCDYVRDAECAHLETEVLVGKPETCTSAGLTEGSKCKKCGEILVEQEVIPALGHTYTAVITAPTCTERGYTTYTCTCNDSYVDDYVDAKGHSYGDWVIVKEATTTEEGLQERSCNCGDTETQSIEKKKASVGLEYKLNTDGESYYVKGIGDCLDVDIVIPSTYDNLPVTRIGKEAFFQCDSLNSITISAGVEVIESLAFFDCRKLTSINIPSTVTVIEGYALGYCTSLTDIVLPNSVTSIGEYIFDGCFSLKSIVIGTGIQVISCGAFSYCTSLVEIVIPITVTNIEEYAFAQCDSLEAIKYEGTKVEWNVIAKGNYWNLDTGDYTIDYLGVERLDYLLNSDGTGYSVVGLGTCSDTDIVIPSEYNGLPVTSIADNAFSDYNFTKKITSVVIPDTVTSIGSCAFICCASLTDISIPDSVTQIGAGAFCECSSLKNIQLPNNLVSINSELFMGDVSLQSIVIPNSVKSIGDSAFVSCTSLTEIIIPNSVTSIGWGAFSDCDSLESITIPFVGASKTKTENDHFGYVFGAYDYSKNSSFIPLSLKTVVITDATKIGEYAFLNCSGLTNIFFPNSIENVGFGALQGCSSLEYCEYRNANYYGNESNPYMIFVNVIDTSITSCSMHADTKFIAYKFSNCDTLFKVLIPDKVVSIPDYTFYNCSNLKDVTIGNSILIIGDHAFAKCESLENVILGSGLLSIKDGAFSGCSSLTNIVITDSVTSVGNYAFDYCSSLKSVTIGKSVTNIGDSLFYGCSSLTNVEILNGVVSIGDYMFGYCTLLENVVIPDSITSIGYGAFIGCTSLTSITIPDSVMSIDGKAFYGCELLEFYDYDNGYYLGNDSNPYYALIKVKDKEITSCEIHKDTKIIAGRAFSSCSFITSITIPNSVTSIGDFAFADFASLTSITIPDTVTNVGYGAFNGCTSLTSVTFENTSGWWRSTSLYATNGTSISSADIADSATAATYLTSTYKNYYWKCD